MKKLIEKIEQCKVGDPLEEGVDIGPVIDEGSAIRIQNWVEEAVTQGAKIETGGGRDRAVVQPTVLSNTQPYMRVEAEEIFGPVMVIMPFDSEEEALRLANDTPYGLTNYVQTNNGARRNRVALGLRSGMVQMNMTSREAGSPFGGVKASGRAREGGMFGLEEFLEVKAISGWDPSSE